MTFQEYVDRRDESVRAINYKPGALIPTVTHRKGGPEHMNIFKAQNPAIQSKPYAPIFRIGKGPKQAASTIANK